MSSSIPSPNTFPYSILPFKVCRIIGAYSGCASEGEAALCLQDSQSKESLEEATNQIIKDIWRAFAEDTSLKSNLLEGWIREFSTLHESRIRERFFLLESQIEQHLPILFSDRAESIEPSPKERPFNFFRLQKLSCEMNAQIDLTVMQTILTLIHLQHPAPFLKSTPLDCTEAIESWILLNQAEINKFQHLALPITSMEVIPEMFLHLSMPNLRSINLSYTKLRKIPPRFGNEWAELESIDLSHSQLEELPEDFGQCWTRLKRINLTNNPMLKKKPQGFGCNWPKDVEIAVDSWLKDEDQESDQMRSAAASSYQLDAQKVLREDKSSQTETVGEEDEEKTSGVKRVLEPSSDEIDEEPSHKKKKV